MKKTYTTLKKYLLVLLVSLSFTKLKPQAIIWSEDFNNGCTSYCNVSAYSGTNGAWTLNSSVGSNGSEANEWFVSCAENGNAVGACGSGCGSNSSLHVGSVPCLFCFLCPSGDCGASYNAIGASNVTNKRAQSPVINCSGYSNITLNFKYIGVGQSCNTDYTNLQYSDNGGTTWSNLQTCLTAGVCGSGQGLWTAFSVALPSSANNNPNVKIGFLWSNNGDGLGSDPSFAVDDVELSVSSVSPPPSANFTASKTSVCDGACISFTDLTTNNPTAWNWSFPGATPSSSSSANPANICYNTPGNYSVTLISLNGSGSDTLTIPNLITVFQLPVTPTVTNNNDTLTCSIAPSYQWFLNGTAISFATSSSYVATQSGNYFVTVKDSNGCEASSASIPVTVQGINENLLANGIHIFPNPFSDEIEILSDKNLPVDFSVSISNCLGEILMKISNLKQNHFSLHTSAFSNGIYFLKLNVGEKMFVSKLIKY